MIRNLLKESFEKVAQLVARREQQLRQMTRCLLEYTEQMKTMEQLKTIEHILFSQQWKDVYSRIHQIRLDSQYMSQVDAFCSPFLSPQTIRFSVRSAERNVSPGNS